MRELIDCLIEKTSVSMPTTTDIEKANEIPIQNVLKDYFDIDVPMEIDSSWKTYCCFAFEHSDGGVDRSMRVYPSNSAHCFSDPDHGFMTPVRIIQIHEGISQRQAARKLLIKYGLFKSIDWRKQFQEILEQKAETEAISASHLVEAIHVALSAHSDWTHLQFDPDVQNALERELTVLDGLLAEGKDASSIRFWYTCAKIELLALCDKLTSKEVS